MMRVQVMPASAAGSATASVAQPQRAGDRGWNASSRTTDIEDLARWTNLDVDARTIASEHASDVPVKLERARAPSSPMLLEDRSR